MPGWRGPLRAVDTMALTQPLGKGLGGFVVWNGTCVLLLQVHRPLVAPPQQIDDALPLQ